MNRAEREQFIIEMAARIMELHEKNLKLEKKLRKTREQAKALRSMLKKQVKAKGVETYIKDLIEKAEKRHVSILETEH
jgi:prophage maintenance system killer protein